MGLDPAIQFLNGNGYTSMLWPQEGSDRLFLAYLPLQGFTHILHQSILPFDIYWVRVPSAIYLLVGGVFLYQVLRIKKLSLFVSLAIVVLVLNEKSLFETTRAIRIEPIIFCLLSAFYYGYNRCKFHISALIITILLFSHPNVWPLCLVLFLSLCLKKQETTISIGQLIKPNTLWLYPIVGILLFFLSINFQWSDFVSQFLHQGSDHSASGGIITRVKSHFIDRFWPYYKTQPWIPILIYAAFFHSVYTIMKRKANANNVAIVATHIVWLIFLGSFYRYNSILVLLSIIGLAETPFIKSYILKKVKWQCAIFALVILSSADVVIRHTMAIAQHQERDPYPVLSWLNHHLPKEEKFIITGSDICYYATADKKNASYFMYNMPPYKHQLSAYRNYYIVTTESLEKGTLISHYNPRISLTSSYFKTKTYASLNLYKIENAKTYHKILVEMDNESRQEVKNR